MGAPARLLVVDDEPRTAEVTAELLRRAGYAVDVALSGTEALSRVRSETPDLMLLDYEMPDMDAPEVLDQLRSGSDRLSFPVIILTGARPSPGDQVLSIERGAADYIAKGTDRQVLLERAGGTNYAGSRNGLGQGWHEARGALNDRGGSEPVGGIESPCAPKACRAGAAAPPALSTRAIEGGAGEGRARPHSPASGEV